MTLEIEDVVVGTIGGDKALSLALGLEARYLPLPSSGRKMGVFDTVGKRRCLNEIGRIGGPCQNGPGGRQTETFLRLA